MTDQASTAALPACLSAHPLVAALPQLDLADADTRDRAAVVLEILAQHGFRNVSVHAANLELVTTLRPMLGARLTFGVHGVLFDDQLADALAVEPAFVLTDRGSAAQIERGRQAGVAVFPAALTPNEILTAAELGAPAVQVFPADVMGGAYGPSLRAILGHVPLIPRAGLGGWAVGRWFESGAACCVVDDALFSDALTPSGNLGQLRDRCVTFIDAVPKTS